MNKPMDDQLVEIKDTIHHWMGELEQIDDILVIGIKI